MCGPVSISRPSCLAGRCPSLCLVSLGVIPGVCLVLPHLCCCLPAYPEGAGPVCGGMATVPVAKWNHRSICPFPSRTVYLWIAAWSLQPDKRNVRGVQSLKPGTSFTSHLATTSRRNWTEFEHVETYCRTSGAVSRTYQQQAASVSPSVWSKTLKESTTEAFSLLLCLYILV